MHKRYKIIVFDLDGTLLDTSEGILSSVIYTLHKFNFPIPEKKLLKKFIGPPIQESFRNTFHITSDKLMEMTNVFRDHYKNVDLLKAVPYDGIEILLSKLASFDYKIAIATYKRQDYAQKLINHFKFSKYINVICGSDFDGKYKKKDIIKLAVRKLENASFCNILMIGDTVHDMQGAAIMNIDFLGVTYGFGYKEKTDISGANVIGAVDKSSDIIKFLGECNEDKIS